MKHVLLTAAAALAFAATSAEADVRFSPMKPDTVEGKIVTVKLPDVTGIKGATIETAVVELDSPTRGAVAVRIKPPQTCDTDLKKCRTVVLKAGKDDWSTVFDRRTETLDLGQSGFGTMKQIVVDHGYEVWDWNGWNYKANLGAVGKALDMQEVKSSYVGYLVQQFGGGAKRLYDRKKNIKVTAAPVDLNGKGQQGFIVAKIEGPGVCGRVLGCPWRVLQVKGQDYQTVLNGYGTGTVYLMPVARGGWRDLAIEIPSGYLVYGWAGKSYGIAEKASNQGGKS